MNPDQFMQANIPMDGEYEGIGAWVDTSTEYLTIISPMPGSPAGTPPAYSPSPQVAQELKPIIHINQSSIF